MKKVILTLVFVAVAFTSANAELLDEPIGCETVYTVCDNYVTSQGLGYAEFAACMAANGC